MVGEMKTVSTTYQHKIGPEWLHNWFHMAYIGNIPQPRGSAGAGGGVGGGLHNLKNTYMYIHIYTGIYGQKIMVCVFLSYHEHCILVQDH